jgi:hypothetical protein
MAAGGKGHAPRPFSVSAETYGNNFDAIFGNKSGRGVPASASGSNPEGLGSTPSAPAIYIDPLTETEVTEDWWPEITHG